MKVILAVSMVARMRGLLFTNPRDLRGSTLVLAPCSSVHTLLMRYSLDIAFIDSGGLVLKTRRDVAPWKFRIACRGAVAVFERPSTQNESWPNVGERVGFAARIEETESDS